MFLKHVCFGQNPELTYTFTARATHARPLVHGDTRTQKARCAGNFHFAENVSIVNYA